MSAGGDEDALLDAVQHDEKDDARAVYADWLEEHGHAERAEYMRLDVRIHALAEDAPMRGELERRAERLGHHLDGEWKKKVARPGPVRVAREVLRAGATPRSWRPAPATAERQTLAPPDLSSIARMPGPRALTDVTAPYVRTPLLKRLRERLVAPKVERTILLVILFVCLCLLGYDELRRRMKSDKYIDLTPAGGRPTVPTNR